MPGNEFYKQLHAFSDFSDLGDLGAYTAVPDDWVVLAADIVRSRDAIASGRYKDVNLIGAAVIASVLNVLDRDNVPFVFGGDGAFVLVPASAEADARTALAGVAVLARDVAQLDLRIAAIPVAHLRGLGTDIRLRKYELSPGNHLAMAIGDGLECAERILKNPEAVKPFAIDPDGSALPSLDGLSCRWEPIPARRGAIVSVIVKPAGGASLASVAERIAEAIGYDPLSNGPDAALLTKDRLRFRFLPRSLGAEIGLVGAAAGRLRYALRAMVECVAFVWGYKSGRRVGPFEPVRYMNELVRNTDHRKLDDSLRLVLDVSDQGLQRLTANLDEAWQAGLLRYGLHVSDRAIMTCFVSDIGESRHVHFIDGADGGFAMAALDFKKRLVDGRYSAD